MAVLAVLLRREACRAVEVEVDHSVAEAGVVADHLVGAAAVVAEEEDNN